MRVRNSGDYEHNSFLGYLDVSEGPADLRHRAGLNFLSLKFQ